MIDVMSNDVISIECMKREHGKFNKDTRIVFFLVALMYISATTSGKWGPHPTLTPTKENILNSTIGPYFQRARIRVGCQQNPKLLTCLRWIKLKPCLVIKGEFVELWCAYVLEPLSLFLLCVCLFLIKKKRERVCCCYLNNRYFFIYMYF